MLAGCSGLRTSWPHLQACAGGTLDFASRAFGSKFRAITRAITHGQPGGFMVTHGRSTDGNAIHRRDKTAAQKGSDLRFLWWPGAGSNRRPSDFQTYTTAQIRGLRASGRSITRATSLICGNVAGEVDKPSEPGRQSSPSHRGRCRARVTGSRPRRGRGCAEYRRSHRSRRPGGGWTSGCAGLAGG